MSTDDPSFEQKTWRETRRATLVEQGVHCIYQSRTEAHDYIVRFEDVLQNPIEYTERRGTLTTDLYEGVLWGLALLFVYVASREAGEPTQLGAFIVAGFCGALALTIRLLRYFPRRQLLQLSSAEPALILCADRPSRDAVGTFVGRLHERTHDYLVDTYGTAAAYESKVGQIERLHRLREDGVISEDEFASLKAELVSPASEEAEQTGQYL